MNFLVLAIFILWIYLLTVFKRGNLNFFTYIFGSVGLFVFMMIYIQPVVTEILVQLVTSVTGVIGNITGLYESYHDYSILFITNSATKESISLYVDYECS